MEVPNPQIICTQLSQNQYLCKLTSVTAKANNYSNTELIIVFDVSGSMGNTVEVIHKLLRKFIVQYNISKTCVITFSSISTLAEYADIRKWNSPYANGSTYLHDGIKKAITRMQNNTTETLYQFLIISDGALHDLDNVLSYVNKVNANELNKHVINVTALRIGIQGDTKALTCFYKFHNHPTCEQLLIDIQHNYRFTESEASNALARIFVQFQEGVVDNSLKVESSNINIRKYPFGECAKVLNLLNNEYFICTNLPNLLIEEKKCIVVEKTTVDENDILDYLHMFDMKVRNLKILGNNELLKTAVVFLENVEKHITKPELGPNISRIAQLKLIRKKQNTIINDIKQLINTNNVDKLNAQQQADFLRKIDNSTRSGRRLAMRGMENSDDILITFQDNTKTWLNSEKSGKTDVLANIIDINTNDEITSFYNLSTNAEIKTNLKEELSSNSQNEIELLNLEDLLRVGWTNWYMF